MEKKEEAKSETKRVWRAKMTCQMPFKDFIKDETIELADSDVTPRVKALFECLTPEQAKAAEHDDDPDFKVMVQRLKAAKIPLKRGISNDDVKKLFQAFLAASSTEVAGEVK